MPSIHFLSSLPDSDAVSRYRCLNLIEQLHSCGWSAHFSFAYHQQGLTIGSDVVVINRILEPEIIPFIREVRTAGKAVVFSLDDLITGIEFAIKQSSDAETEFEREKKWYEANEFALRASTIIRECNCVLTSTEFIADRLRNEGLEVYVLRNTLPEELARISEQTGADNSFREGRVMLGYFSGSPTHNTDLEEIASSICEAFRLHENLYLMLVGPVAIPTSFEHFRNRLRLVPRVEWRSLPQVLAQVDINLAPLDLTSAFSHGKSHIKWLEAAAVGVPTIAAGTAELALSINHGVNGFLAYKNEDWRGSLESLVSNPGLRAEVGKQAKGDAFTKHRALNEAAKTVQVFDEILTKFARSRPSVTVPFPRLGPHRAKTAMLKGIAWLGKKWRIVKAAFAGEKF